MSKPGNWTQAKDGCVSRNSQLVTIANDEENSFIATLATNFSWIGVEWNDTIFDYVWVDGSDIAFTDRWISEKQKKSRCVGICDNLSSDLPCGDGLAGSWHQDECLHLKSYVCEREGKASRNNDNSHHEKTILNKTFSLKFNLGCYTSQCFAQLVSQQMHLKHLINWSFFQVRRLRHVLICQRLTVSGYF